MISRTIPLIGLFTQYAGLPRPIYVLFFARIVNRMGDFVHFFLTLFLTQVMGMEEAATGAYVMAVSLSRIAGSMIAGKLGDQLGRKAVMVASLALFASTLVVCGLFLYSQATPILLVIAGLFNGAERPLNNTIVADITTPDERKRAFSLLYLGINLGVAVGPLIAGFLFHTFIRWIFFGDAITSFIAVVLILRFVPESRPADTAAAGAAPEDRQDERAETGTTLRAFLRRPVLAASAFFMLASSFIYAQHMFTLPLQLDGLFGADSARLYGVIMSLNAGVVLLFTTVLLALSRRIAPLRSIAVAILLYGAGFGMLGFVADFRLFLVSAFVWTIGEILVFTNYNVFVANHTPMSHRGRFNGLLQIIIGLGFALSPFASGFLVETIGVSSIWRILGACAVGLSAGTWLLAEIDERRRSRVAADGEAGVRAESGV